MQNLGKKIGVALGILTIFLISKLFIYFIFQQTADAKIVGSNFFHSNAYTWRYSSQKSSLEFSDLNAKQVTLIATLSNDLWRDQDQNPPYKLLISPNGTAPQVFTFDQQDQTMTVVSTDSAITSLDFTFEPDILDKPWALRYLTTEQSFYTNLLGSPQVTFDANFTAFEDWNVNPALSFSAYLTQWDSAYYLDIAEHGYSYNGNYLDKQNIAWPYLFPLLIAAAHHILPGQTYSSLGVAINLVLSLAGFVLLYAFARKVLHLEKNSAFLPLLLLAFSPFAIFLTTIHSEALFIMLLLCFLWALIAKKSWLAAIFLMLAATTRTVALPLVVLFWLQDFYLDKKPFSFKSVSKNIALTFISLAGFLSFLLHISLKFHTSLFDPLKIQQAWQYNVPGTASLLKFAQNIWLPFSDLKNFIFNPYYSGLFLSLACLVIVLWQFVPLIKSYLFKQKRSIDQPIFLLSCATLILLAANYQTLLYQPNYTLGRLCLPALSLVGLIFTAKLSAKKNWLLPWVILYLIFSTALYFWYSLSVMNGELPC